jgi:23S rRNA (cytosine1962-C5)-methyltransferase
LPKFLQAALEAGHPWVYRNHIPSEFRAPTGTWVRVQCGDLAAWGLWDGESQVALRIYSTRGPLAQPQVTELVQRAWHLRQPLLTPDTTAFRLINGEGDGLPAIVVDIYGSYAVLATYGSAVQVLVPMVVAALKQVLTPRGILLRPMSASEHGPSSPQWVAGEPAPRDLVIEEHGARFFADLVQGHKTGLYLDQRENRVTLGQFSRGANVLNLYAYTGGFSVHAALAGAARVTSVDIAAPALQRAQDNFRLNRLDPAEHEFVTADCYEFLKQRALAPDRFDLIVCDPPSLAHSRAQLEAALQAYTRLNAHGLRAVRDGGYYAASSCTAQVSPDAFREMLVQATRRAGRSAQIVHESGHAWDHPVKLAHPEGRYLKFVVLRVGDAKSAARSLVERERADCQVERAGRGKSQPHLRD